MVSPIALVTGLSLRFSDCGLGMKLVEQEKVKLGYCYRYNVRIHRLSLGIAGMPYIVGKDAFASLAKKGWSWSHLYTIVFFSHFIFKFHIWDKMCRKNSDQIHV